MSTYRTTVAQWLCVVAVLAMCGCARSRNRIATISSPRSTNATSSAAPPFSVSRPRPETLEKPAASKVELVSATGPPQAPQAEIVPAPLAVPEAVLPVPEVIGDLNSTSPLELGEVIESVITSYPLLRSAMFQRNIAQGDLLASKGEFDLKLKAESLNMPQGFYDNYRQSIGAEQPLFWGGSLFGGYRLGRGSFPVYYGERETLQGGEFRAGVLLPLAQNRSIDDRRAALMRNRWEVQAVEPEIKKQLIEFIREATISYWYWVAAGKNVKITENLLNNAVDRNDGLQTRVEKGDAPAIELTDNQRLIVSRRTKLIDAQRKFQQASYKLSLFLRDETGQPRVVDETLLPPAFPKAPDPSVHALPSDIQTALANRPELRAIAFLNEQLQIDLAAAKNLLLPQVDALLAGSQDVGNPSDPKKNDKSPYELEAGLLGSVPLQRRKGQGKIAAVEGKLVQLRAKEKFTRDKIVAEVQSASAALFAAYQQLDQSHQSVELATRMEAAERRRFELGDSNLLLVNLREQATADAAVIELEARLNYFDAEADYRAALATDVVP